MITLYCRLSEKEYDSIIESLLERESKLSSLREGSMCGVLSDLIPLDSFMYNGFTGEYLVEADLSDEEYFFLLRAITTTGNEYETAIMRKMLTQSNYLDD